MPVVHTAPAQTSKFWYKYFQRQKSASALDIIMEAISSVASEKLRTMLTMLGTILGVGSFAAIMGARLNSK